MFISSRRGSENSVGMCGTWGIRHGLAPFARLRATNVGEPAWGDPDLPEYVSAAGLDG